MAIQKPDYQLLLPLEIEEVSSSEDSALSAEDIRLRSEAARQLFDEAAFPWMGEYRKLRDGGWDWRVAAYIAWAASPRDDRTPKTQDELAQGHLGLKSDRAISTWRRRNPAIDEMVALLQSAPLWEHRAEIYRALITVAKSAEYKGHNDRKLALELLGDYMPAAKLEAILSKSAKGGDVDTDDEESLAKLEREARKLSEGKADGEGES